MRNTSPHRRPKLDEKTEALIAAALYDELAPEERAQFEAQLAENPALRTEWVDMRTMVGAIPARDVEFRGNLLPALRQQIAEDKQRQAAWLPLKWFAPFALGGVAVVAALTYGGGSPATAPGSGGGFSPTPSPVPAVAALVPVQLMLEEADILAANRNWAEARETLETLVAQYPNEPQAALAQHRLADLYFSHLNQYPQSYAAYQTLRDRFPETFSANPVNVDRFNLLAEASAADFEPLHLLAEARDSGAGSFQQLEALIAAHPDSFIASLAVDSMRDFIAVPKSLGGGSQALALEAVRERCTHPVAVAQVNLALGRLYAGELGDVETARTLYQSVADTGPDLLAESARRALEELARAQ